MGTISTLIGLKGVMYDLKTHLSVLGGINNDPFKYVN